MDVGHLRKRVTMAIDPTEIETLVAELARARVAAARAKSAADAANARVTETSDRLARAMEALQVCLDGAVADVVEAASSSPPIPEVQP